jgi:hypothetical protein
VYTVHVSRPGTVSTEQAILPSKLVEGGLSVDSSRAVNQMDTSSRDCADAITTGTNLGGAGPRDADVEVSSSLRAQAGELSVGASVQVHSLVGVLEMQDTRTGLWKVKITEGHVLSLKAQNLKLLLSSRRSVVQNHTKMCLNPSSLVRITSLLDSKQVG